MTHYEIAKQANSIARKIAKQTKNLKDETERDYATDAQWTAHNIAEMCVELSNLLLPIRY